MEQPELGRRRRFCSNACRQRAYRSRSVFPEAMAGRRWVRADGKRPVQPDGSSASVSDPSTWVPFDRVQSGAGDGFGVMLGDGLACLDFDHVLENGAVPDWVAEVVADHTDAPLFVERSMSGDGLHVFFEYPERAGWRRGRVEFASRRRFIRATGDRITL